MQFQSNRSLFSLSLRKEVSPPLPSTAFWGPPLRLFFIGGRVLLQGVHHEHHVWPRWDRGVTGPHDLKAQEAERLQERSYQREGNWLPPNNPPHLRRPRSHEYPRASSTLCELLAQKNTFLTRQRSQIGGSVSACVQHSCPKRRGDLGCAAEQVRPRLSRDGCASPSEAAVPGYRPARPSFQLLFCTYTAAALSTPERVRQQQTAISSLQL